MENTQTSERLYIDIERGCVVSESELYEEWKQFSETEKFLGYLDNCLSKNGTLERIQ